MPGSRKSSPNFHQMALNDFLAMSSVPKKYFGFLVDEISERGHTIKRRKPNSKYSLYDFRLKASFKPQLKIVDVSLEMSGDPKNYFGFT